MGSGRHWRHDRGLPPAPQASASRPAPDHRIDHLVLPERGQVAEFAEGVRSLVEGSPDVHPLGQARCMGTPAGHSAGARRATGHDLPGRQHHPGAPKAASAPQKGAVEPDALKVKLLADLWRLWNHERQQAAHPTAPQARSADRAGAGVITGSSGCAIAFSLAPGQAHELPQAIGLLARLPGAPRWVVVDAATPTMPSVSTSGT